MAETNRYVPVEVRATLERESRGRCCICGGFVGPAELELKILGENLERHHIEYYSLGGDNTVENLIPVCPNCHAKIHTRPEQHPADSLRKAKEHWQQMTQLVPEDLYFTDEEADDSTDDRDILSVRFHILSLNLTFLTHVRSSVTVERLSRFLRWNVMHPLLAYARLAPFKWMLHMTRSSFIQLTRSGDNHYVLPYKDTLASLSITSDDVFFTRMDFHTLASNRGRELVSVKLQWQSRPQDLDLHLFIAYERGLTQVFYRSMGTLDEHPWAKLDQDVQDGFGPETIKIGMRSRSHYIVAVHNFSHEVALTESSAEVTLLMGDQHHEVRCPKQGEGLWWHVMSIAADSGSVRIINELRAEPPASSSPDSWW